MPEEFDEDEYYNQLYYEELYKENLAFEIAKKEHQKSICPNCEHLWEYCTCQKLD